MGRLAELLTHYDRELEAAVRRLEWAETIDLAAFNAAVVAHNRIIIEVMKAQKPQGARARLNGAKKPCA